MHCCSPILWKSSGSCTSTFSLWNMWYSACSQMGGIWLNCRATEYASWRKTCNKQRQNSVMIQWRETNILCLVHHWTWRWNYWRAYANKWSSSLHIFLESYYLFSKNFFAEHCDVKWTFRQISPLFPLGSSVMFPSTWPCLDLSHGSLLEPFLQVIRNI